MKKSMLISWSYFSLAALLLISCTKQISEPAAVSAEATGSSGSSAFASLSSTGCRPASYAVYAQNGSTTVYYSEWTNVNQKWYNGSQIANMKSYYGPSYGLPLRYSTQEPFYTLFWGAVTYNGSNVSVRDEVKEMKVIDVTLNGSGKPSVAYFHNQTNDQYGRYRKDTTYFYYTGDRLDSLRVNFEMIRFTNGMIERGSSKYVFNYDTFGNVTLIQNESGALIASITYDYSRPVAGYVSPLIVSNAFRLVEDLELIRLPMHHVVTLLHGPGFDTINFSEYVIEDGLVKSYKWNKPFGFDYSMTYYTGWDCGGSGTRTAPIGRNGISGLDEFRKVYSQNP